MHLIQIFLPVNETTSGLFGEMRRELTDRFGGMTAFMQSPAEGLWKDERDHVTRDKIVVVEVMSPGLDHSWWSHYRRDLEKRFHQEAVVIRVMLCEML